MLRRILSSSLTVAVALVCAQAGAQAPQNDVVFLSKPIDSCDAGPVFDRAVRPGPAGRGLRVLPSTNAPYSGVGTTTVVRTLADGNRIVRTNTMRYARDGKGRTRTEYSLAALGPFALEESRTMVTIEDPVAQRRYVLHPDQRRANVFDTAAEQAMLEKMMKQRAGAPSQARGAAKGEAQAITGVIAQSVTMSPGPGTISATTLSAGPAPDGGTFMMATAGTPMPFVAGCGPSGLHASKMPPAVSLGERMLEGVKVVGSRHEFEIAAGEIGNEQPIRVRTEQWFSPDLNVVVESLHQDPMVGETTYKLSHIRQGEPDAALFAVPSGYTTQEMPGPRFQVFEKPLAQDEAGK